MKALPHEVHVAQFLAEIGDLYDLPQMDIQELRDEISRAVSAAAINTIANRPRSEPEMTPQGVQDGPEFMRPAEVSIALGIPQSTLANMRGRGTGPAFRKEGKAILYGRAAVRNWAAQDHTVPVLGTAPINEAQS